jgi:hypothetical protein
MSSISSSSRSSSPPVPTSGAESGTQPQGILERFHSAVALIDTAPAEAVAILTELQHEVAARALFSANETVQDISSRSLLFLTVEHYLAAAYTSLRTGPAEMADRQRHVQLAGDLWASFLLRLEQLELLDKTERQHYRDLCEQADATTATENGSKNVPAPAPPANRNVKIARFRAKQEAQQERQRFQSLLARRGRLEVAAQDEMDGHDEESLERNVALATIQVCKVEAMEEWSSALRELPMIARMVQSQQDLAGRERHTGTGNYNYANRDGVPDASRPLSDKPFQLTHITQNAATGQLLIRKEEIQSQVFRAGWNQPTMSLEELGDREVEQAIERGERQTAAEAQQKLDPRRYEQLVKDGMEDDSDLVDASAELDRQWDRFRDENPRGSGNKRGDVGDRNF